MRILFMQLVLPVVCYFIGVFVGKRTVKMIYSRELGVLMELVNRKLAGEDIQHVEYTPEQMGYDK